MIARLARIGEWTLPLLVLAGLLLCHSARAAPHASVVVQGNPSDPVVARLVPELRAAGYEVRTVPLSAGDTATLSDSDAFLRVTRPAVEVWLVDRATRRATELDTVGIDAPRAEHVAVTSVRVSEVLRAHLLPVEPSSSPPTPTPTQNPSRTAHLALAIGPLLLLAPGGTPPALDLSLSPEWHPSPSIRLRTVVAVPLLSPNLASTEGRARVSTWLAGAALDWQLRSRDALWTATLGAGADAVSSRTQGSATAPYIGSSASTVTAVPFVEVGGSRGLGTPRVRLGVDGTLGLAIPEVAIVFAGHQVASWGRPLGTASLVLAIDLL